MWQNVDGGYPYTVTETNKGYIFSATGLPDGMVINSGTGIISGTPTTANPLGGTITVTA
jgi:hypothetical protein